MDTKIYGSQGSAAILGILRPRDVAPGESFAQKRACERVHLHATAKGREIRSCHEQMLMRHTNMFYPVDLWTATGIWVQQTQQSVARHLAKY